jgi:hypothetical protein
MPKSGHMANQHAKVAAAAIIQLLQGRAGEPTPVVMNTCYSFVTATDVVHVASVHQYDAKPTRPSRPCPARAACRRGQPDRGPLRAELGRQHLGRHADPAGWA